MDMTLPHGPDFFQFGTTARMMTALTEVGFTDVTAFSFDQNWHVANADSYVHASSPVPFGRGLCLLLNRAQRPQRYALTLRTI
jgi:hypothetical protein